ncbi:hypothetical protein R1flu_019432 [Riccia fluitans]|uniref:Uncharacterized protein n=1 Tax=Riccia fluitans TaxID=41844 RepID=A0ABD1ZMH4_9MARC
MLRPTASADLAKWAVPLSLCVFRSRKRRVDHSPIRGNTYQRCESSQRFGISSGIHADLTWSREGGFIQVGKLFIPCSHRPATSYLPIVRLPPKGGNVQTPASKGEVTGTKGSH